MRKIWLKSSWILSRCLHTSSPLGRKTNYLPCPPEYKREVNPVVVLFGWLFAKGRHLEKFGQLYQELIGADVLTTKMEVSEILRPKKAGEIAVQVLDELTSPAHQEKPIIVHGLSAGGYLYSHVLKKIVTMERFIPVKDRIAGQVYDSPVDFAGVPNGIAKAVTKNAILRNTITTSIDSYLNLTHRYTKKIYLEQSELFHNNPVRSPTLFLFSKDDAIADVDTIYKCQLHYRKLGIPVVSQCWDSSPHVSHFYVHQKEYTKLLTNFLRDLNLE